MMMMMMKKKKKTWLLNPFLNNSPSKTTTHPKLTEEQQQQQQIEEEENEEKENVEEEDERNAENYAVFNPSTLPRVSGLHRHIQIIDHDQDDDGDTYHHASNEDENECMDSSLTCREELCLELSIRSPATATHHIMKRSIDSDSRSGFSKWQRFDSLFYAFEDLGVVLSLRLRLWGSGFSGCWHYGLKFRVLWILSSHCRARLWIRVLLSCLCMFRAKTKHLYHKDSFGHHELLSVLSVLQ